ncbi:hypothetical protein Tco_1175485 [Tanacetum coccineum]
MAQQPMRSEEELCPTNLRFPPNKSNVRINREETQDEPIFEINISGTLNALQISPRQPNIQFVPPPVQDELVHFIKRLGYADPLTTVSQGVVTSANVDFAQLLWEDFRFQVNKYKNLATKHATIPYPRLTKLIIGHLLSQNPNLNKCLDSLSHLIAEEAWLEKLKYVAKGERKPTFGMPIPEAIMSSEMKESQPL